MKTAKFLLGLALMAGIITACSDAKGDKSGTPSANSNNTEAVINNIMTRTSIRQFTSQPVSKDTLENLVKAGMAAPSAVNKQPWAFIVITDRAMLDSLNAIAGRFNLKTATAAIAVCGDLSKALEGEGQAYWVQDCSAATENILLAAHAYGLGAVWCGVYPNPEVQPDVTKTLGLPENIIPLNIIALGYPDETPQPKDKFNASNIHYQKW